MTAIATRTAKKRCFLKWFIHPPNAKGSHGPVQSGISFNVNGLLKISSDAWQRCAGGDNSWVALTVDEKPRHWTGGCWFCHASHDKTQLKYAYSHDPLPSRKSGPMLDFDKRRAMDRLHDLKANDGQMQREFSSVQKRECRSVRCQSSWETARNWISVSAGSIPVGQKNNFRPFFWHLDFLLMFVT
jgi:hypothetical protein